MDGALAIPGQLEAARSPRRALFAGATVTAVSLSAVAVTLGASAATTEHVANAVIRGALVGAPMAAGLYAAHLERFERFARLLYATGLLAFVTTLAETGDPALYTLGRAAGWGVEVLIVVLLLAYPTGRLLMVADRRVAEAMTATVVVFFLPTLLLAEAFRVPSPWTSCAADCPSNALFALDAEPAFVDAVLRVPGALAVLVL